MVVMREMSGRGGGRLKGRRRSVKGFGGGKGSNFPFSH